MRILILNYEYPPLGGGAGIVTKHLAERLALKGHQVHVVTTWFPGEPELSSEGNLSIMRLRSRRRHTFKSNPLEMYSWVRHAIRYFKELSDDTVFDVCLANFTMPGGIVAKFVNKKFKTPYVILSHGHDIPWFAPQQMMLWHFLFYFNIKSIVNGSKKLILLTEQLKMEADKFVGIKKAADNIVIPNGLLMDDAKAESSSKNEVLQIIFVGRMVEQKDPISFVKACKLINNMKIPVHFTMIGDGPLKETVEKMILKLGIQNIEVMGQVSHYQVLKTYESTHIMIQPSREEAMSIAALEAISRGIYMITTKVSGNTELIKKQVNGDFVKFGDATSIAEHVADFYYNKFLKGYEYPSHILEFLSDKYSWESVVNNYEHLFFSICANEKKHDVANDSLHKG